MNPDTPITPKPTWRFDHVNVAVGGTQALRTLFEGVMGLAPGHRPPFPFPGLWLYDGDHAVVHAVEDAGLSAANGELRFGHVAFRSVEPAAGVIERVRRSALPFKVAHVPEDNTVQVFVMLPGGFVVELDVSDDKSNGAAADHAYSAMRAAPGKADF